MDAISYSYADKQAKRIKKFNENPDSASGILTQPSVIQAGEIVTIPLGRTAIMANTVIDGTINLDGTIFIPSGATTDDIDAQLALKAPLENPIFTSAISTKDVNYKSTPITITSWSYSGTTVTLNVTSHTFIAGDYIEVTGLTSTTKPANGIFVVTSVTSGTIVFTSITTPTGSAGVSSATVKGYTTINGKVIDFTGIKQSLTGSGYAYLDNKLIIQWFGASLSASSQGTFTFPISFPTSMLSIAITHNTTTGQSNPIRYYNYTASSIEMVNEGISPTIARCIVIGY